MTAQPNVQNLSAWVDWHSPDTFKLIVNGQVEAPTKGDAPHIVTSPSSSPLDKVLVLDLSIQGSADGGAPDLQYHDVHYEVCTSHYDFVEILWEKDVLTTLEVTSVH